jgi:hypothetical protein
MKIGFTAKSVIALALIASLFSFVKFDHCYTNNWASPDVYTHACYSDIPALFGARDVIKGAWPYSSATNAVEYPPVTGLIMWATGKITPKSQADYQYYFLINIGLLALLFIGTSLLVAKINPKKWYLLPLLPAVIGSLYINWDMWAVVTAVLSIYWFDQKKYRWSAIALGVAIATKFFPIVLLAPVAVIFVRRRDPIGALKYVVTSIEIWLIINIPFAVVTPTGWWRFFKLNSERGADFGSMWYSLQILGLKISGLNGVSIVTFVIMAIAASIFFLKSESTPTLGEISIVFIMIFTIASKVYSPQYVLWLAPLGVIALRQQKDRAAFWIWQGSELLYHIAVWEYLATVSGTKFGLPDSWYAVAGLIRVAASCYFAVRIALSTRVSVPQADEFPESVIQSYP